MVRMLYLYYMRVRDGSPPLNPLYYEQPKIFIPTELSVK